jgi:hypothetical protein
MRAQWEVELIGGALRDEFCRAGGRPLAGWSVSGEIRGVSDEVYAFGQQFPNPSPGEFRARVAKVGERYGFTVVSVRMLRPLQFAPLVVVATDRDRRAFVRDVPAIMALLNPSLDRAVTFEGFFFEARDDAGVFVSVNSARRGVVRGSQWSWDPCRSPFPHSLPSGYACPDD